MHRFFRHTISLVMILAVLSLSVTCFCSDHGTESKIAAGTDCGHCATEGHPPSNSDESPVAPDHGDLSCGCYCHMQLPAESFKFGYSPHTISLVILESFKSLPEVYLPKFVPPQILV